MKRVESNAEWSLFCPNEAPGLADVHSDEFEALFERYEREGRARKTLPAQKLWYAILEAQIETGTPFMLYKDAANGADDRRREGLALTSRYSEVESAELGHDQVVELVHGDYRVLCAG